MNSVRNLTPDCERILSTALCVEPGHAVKSAKRLLISPRRLKFLTIILVSDRIQFDLNPTHSTSPAM